CNASTCTNNLSRITTFFSNFFFFSSRRRHTRSKRDWSSDVCSSDLTGVAALDEVLEKIDSPNKYSLGKTIDKAAHNLFGALRYFDDENKIKRIYVQGFDHGAISAAYMNRLNKAAAGHHFH